MSDQDFFFDEDETPAAKQPKSAQTKKPAAPSSKSRPAAPAAQAQSVTYTVAALIGVAALLLGVIVGILLPVDVGGTSTATPTATTLTGQTQAPALTNEQMQSGQLPPGHPSIGASTSPTGSATTTP